MNQKEMEERFSGLEGRVKALEEQIAEIEGSKQRGPKTERPMTAADAYRVKFGDHKLPMSHKDAAASLGLSYGQVFSCRGGYTFKAVKDGSRNPDGSEKVKPEGAK